MYHYSHIIKEESKVQRLSPDTGIRENSNTGRSVFKVPNTRDTFTKNGGRNNITTALGIWKENRK